MNTYRKRRALAALALGAGWGLVVPSPATAQDAAARGLEIAQEADLRDSGFGDFEAQMRMVLRNRHGEESVREMRTQTLEVEGDGDKTLVIFDQPRDVEGTALLSFTHKVGPDDQWLYLPALRRVKRIASDNKAGPFMGSEFAFEDISSQEVEKYTYNYLGEEVVDGVSMYMIERIPVDEKSGYSKQIGWYDQDEYRLHKVDFYDRRGDLLKTLTYHGYQLYLDDFWRADQMSMVNHQTGKSTDLFWDSYDFGVGLDERDFDQNALRRAR